MHQVNNRYTHHPQLIRHFRLDWYFDTNGDFIKLPSSFPQSDEARVNRIMERIHREQGKWAYIKNRVREQVSALVLQEVFPGSRVSLSSLVNDICYHVDAVMQYDQHILAIDFTENPHSVGEKVENSQNGMIFLRNPSNQLVSLPFGVMYLSRDLVDNVASKLENLIKEISQVSKEGI